MTNSHSVKNHLILCFGYLWVLDAYLGSSAAFFRISGSSSLIYAYNLLRYMAYFLLLANFLAYRRFVVFRGYHIAVFSLFLSPTLGFSLWNVDEYFLRHIITLTLPIIGIVSGIVTYRYHASYLSKFVRLFERYALVPVLLIFIYFILYKQGIIVYLGVSNALALVLALALTRKKPVLVVIVIFALLLAAKRSEIIAAFIIMMVYFRSLGSVRKEVFIITLICVVTYSIQFLLPGLWGRFHLLLNLLQTFGTFNEDIFNTATSGRFLDMKVAYNLIDEPWKFLFGVGAGYSYFLGDEYVVYYSHFTPLSYLVLGGGIYLAWVIIFIATTLYSTKRSARNFYFYSALYYTVISIFGGAVLFTSVFGWFCLGVVYAANKQKTYDVK